MYESVTKYLADLEKAEEHGDWIIDRKNPTATETTAQMPFVEYDRTVANLKNAIYAFIDGHPGFELKHYNDILEEHGIAWSMRSMSEVDASRLDGRATMALLVGAMRAERLCDGALLEFLESGCIRRWRLRLQEIDQ